MLGPRQPNLLFIRQQEPLDSQAQSLVGIQAMQATLPCFDSHKSGASRLRGPISTKNATSHSLVSTSSAFVHLRHNTVEANMEPMTVPLKLLPLRSANSPIREAGQGRKSIHWEALEKTCFMCNHETLKFGCSPLDSVFTALLTACKPYLTTW